MTLLDKGSVAPVYDSRIKGYRSPHAAELDRRIIATPVIVAEQKAERAERAERDRGAKSDRHAPIEHIEYTFDGRSYVSEPLRPAIGRRKLRKAMARSAERVAIDWSIWTSDVQPRSQIPLSVSYVTVRDKRNRLILQDGSGRRGARDMDLRLSRAEKQELQTEL